jgi:hypothetical protein
MGSVCRGMSDGHLVCGDCSSECDLCGELMDDWTIMVHDRFCCISCFQCRRCGKEVKHPYSEFCVADGDMYCKTCC